MPAKRALFNWQAVRLFLATLIFTVGLAVNAHGQTFTVLYTPGSGAQGGLTFDAIGNLYGATAGGGTFGYGTIFELSPGSGNTWNQTILFNMSDLQAISPKAR